MTGIVYSFEKLKVWQEAFLQTLLKVVDAGR